MSIKPSHSLILRLSSALILMPVVLFALIYGGWPFLVLLGAAVILSLKEWAGMAKLASSPWLNGIVGFAYIILCIASYGYLRLHYPDGAGLALILILAIWASDSGAYFSGKAIGGPKMAPAISPNKTWAGLIGGVASSTLAFVLYGLYIGPALSGWLDRDMTILEGMPLMHVALLGASITVSGQIGDLLISKEKRMVGVKDTGQLIPGHGGLLDRIDSLLLASLVFIVTLKAIGV